MFMFDMFLLDPYTNALPILWDVAISLLIIRLAFFYFSLTFITGCISGYVRQKIIVPRYHLSQSTAELLELPFMLLAIYFWARLIVLRCSVPKVAWMRLAIGFIALGCMLVVEFFGAIFLHEEGRKQRNRETDKIARGAFDASLLLFGLMPWLLMVTGDNERMPVLKGANQEDDYNVSDQIYSVN